MSVRDRKIILIQFEPAFALHVYLKLSNLSYETENSQFTSFLSGDMPAMVIPDGRIVNGIGDALSILASNSTSSLEVFTAYASSLHVQELTNVLESIPTVRAMKYKMSRGISAFDFGWLRLVESCEVYYKSITRGNIISSAAGDAELFSAQVRRLQVLYLEVESVLCAIAVQEAGDACSTDIQDHATKLAYSERWSVACDALLFDHVMKLFLFSDCQFPNPQESVTAVSDADQVLSMSTGCPCVGLYAFLRAHCPSLIRRLDCISSTGFSGDECGSSLESNRFVTSSRNHKLLCSYLNLDECHSDNVGTSSCISAARASGSNRAAIAAKCCIPEFRLELSAGSLIAPIYRAAALLHRRWRTVVQFVSHQVHQKPQPNAAVDVDPSADPSVGVTELIEKSDDLPCEHVPPNSNSNSNSGTTTAVATATAIVSIKLWDIVFSSLVLGCFVGFSLSRR